MRHQIFLLTSLSVSQPAAQAVLGDSLGHTGVWRRSWVMEDTGGCSQRKPCTAVPAGTLDRDRGRGGVSRGNCESYSQPLPVQRIFISLSTLKQAIHYFMYVQCAQTQEDLKASTERAKPAWSLRQHREILPKKCTRMSSKKAHSGGLQDRLHPHYLHQLWQRGDQRHCPRGTCGVKFATFLDLIDLDKSWCTHGHREPFSTYKTRIHLPENNYMQPQPQLSPIWSISWFNIHKQWVNPSLTPMQTVWMNTVLLPE